MRSCWKIPKAAMVDADGAPAFPDLAIYDQSAMFVYAIASAWDQPDVVDAGGKREELSKPLSRARFLRTTVRRVAADPVDPDQVLSVKASAVLQDDDVLEADVPFVLFASDVADDVVGMSALAEASRRIAEEKASEGS